MTDEEMVKVAAVVALADGGCPACVRHLTKELLTTFPGFDWPGMVSAAFGSEINVDDDY